MTTKTKKLKNGMEIPLMGLGTSKITGPVNIVYESIKSGVRLIDTAYKYGNEKEVGEGIALALKDTKLNLKREDLTIMGKIWLNYRNDPESALRNTLKNLQLDYIDIYMDHWPSGEDYREIAIKKFDRRDIKYDPRDKFKMTSVYEFWPKMEKLVELGLAKSIGVSNYNIQCLSNLLSFCKIKPVVNEIEYHLFYIQNTLKEFCDKQEIAVISYYPMSLGNGAKMLILKNPHNPEFDIRKDKFLNELAEKKGATIGQIILSWHIESGVIPIPSTSHKGNDEIMKENLYSFKFELTKEEFDELSHHFKQRSLKKLCGCIRFFGINVLA